VLAGEQSYSDAVRDGLYVPLGAGSVDIAEFVAVLERSGYSGWYVLEQDAMLDAEPPADGGPVGDVRASLEFLRSVLQPAA
jgi:inosose dehydratase